MSGAVRATALLALVAAAGAAACDDRFGPLDWDATPDTLAVFSLARPDLLGLPSALDLVTVLPVRVETPGATGGWDVALSERDGAFVLLPAGAVPGINARAGIAVVEGRSFDEIERAPGDTAAYVKTEPVPLRLDVVYVVRAGRPDRTSCVYYSKLRPLAVNASAGRAEFEIVRNPVCSDRYLLPPSQR